MIKVKVLQMRGQELVERRFNLFTDDFDRPMDLYEMVATKMGWKEIDDPLWFLSTKNVLRVIRIDDFTCNQDGNVL